MWHEQSFGTCPHIWPTLCEGLYPQSPHFWAILRMSGMKEWMGKTPLYSDRRCLSEQAKDSFMSYWERQQCNGWFLHVAVIFFTPRHEINGLQYFIALNWLSDKVTWQDLTTFSVSSKDHWWPLLSKLGVTHGSANHKFLSMATQSSLPFPESGSGLERCSLCLMRKQIWFVLWGDHGTSFPFSRTKNFHGLPWPWHIWRALTSYFVECPSVRSSLMFAHD